LTGDTGRRGFNAPGGLSNFLISLLHESPIYECAGETITAVHEGEGDGRYVETAGKPAGFRLSRVHDWTASRTERVFPAWECRRFLQPACLL